MANINKNKSENDLKKVISDVAKEEIEMKSKKSTSKSDKKSANKSVKKIVKKVTKKTIKKEIEKKTKKKETNGLDLIKPIVVGGRSRKKKENIDNIFDENLKPIVEDKKKSDINEIKNEDLVINDEKELFKDDNINNNKTEKNEVKNDDNNGLSIKNLNNKVVNTNDIDDDEIFKDDDKIERVEKKKMESPKEKKQISKVVVVGIVVVAILFFAIFIATKTMKTVIPNVTAVNNITDLNKKLDASLVPPKEIKNIQYGIEGDGVARMDYARKSDNGTMNLIFKMSKDPDKDLYSESHNWGERIIYINVACDDGTVINVESYEALDDVTALIALWKDNNEYYSLFTKDVSTKEDFYREVNQIVATNHKV